MSSITKKNVQSESLGEKICGTKAIHAFSAPNAVVICVGRKVQSKKKHFSALLLFHMTLKLSESYELNIYLLNLTKN